MTPNVKIVGGVRAQAHSWPAVATLKFRELLLSTVNCLWDLDCNTLFDLIRLQG